MTEQGREPPSKLRWRCRRGMRELDVLLGRWLDESWAEADDELRKQFRQLLEHEDNLLWDWLSGRTKPEGDLADIVEVIGERAPSAKP